MSLPVFALLALFLAGALIWQLASGMAMGAWWYPRVVRAEHPVAYWLVVAAQTAILVALLLTGKSWRLR